MIMEHTILLEQGMIVKKKDSAPKLIGALSFIVYLELEIKSLGLLQPYKYKFPLVLLG